MKRILLIKLRYLGDVVLCTPLLPLIRKQFPQAKLTFIVNPGTERILDENPYVDEVLVLPRYGWKATFEFIRGLRHAHFDAVIDLTDADRSALLSWFTGAPIRVGFNRENRWRGMLYTETLPSEYGSMHMVAYHAQGLGALGISGSVGNPELYVNDDVLERTNQLLVTLSEQVRPFVLIHPTARYHAKAWPLERFAKLVDWLHVQGMTVAVIGSLEERPIGQHIINLSMHSPVNLMGETEIPELISLMKRSALLIGNDGGPLHMAAAVGCPVLGIFGPTDPAVWGPRGHHVQVMYKGLDCHECFYSGCVRKEDSCLHQISLEEVCDAAQALLSAESPKVSSEK